MATADLITDTASNLAAQTRGEIDSQIATAKAYPRSIADCKALIEAMALSDPETAEQMFYVVPRAGKKVEGPSVRLAEIVAYSWQNIRFESKIVAADDRFVTAQATVMDVERNTAGRGECKRRITTKEGKRFSDDMVQTTCNAACAIALREAVFRVVPRVMVDPIWKKAKQLAVGNVKSLAESIAAALRWAAKAGAEEARVLAALGRQEPNQITAEDVATLRGIKQALQEGSTTLEEAFPPIPPTVHDDDPANAVEISKETIETLDPREGAVREELEPDTDGATDAEGTASETETDQRTDAAGSGNEAIEAFWKHFRSVPGLTKIGDVKTARGWLEKEAKRLELGDGVQLQIAEQCDTQEAAIRDKRGERSNKQGELLP